MRTSLETNHITLALAFAQGKMRNPEKNRTAKIPLKTGGSYEYHYADLASSFDACREALSEYELSHASTVEFNDNGRYMLYSRISHSSGQWIEAEWPIAHAEDPKSIAASITYGTRYLFSMLAGIAGEEDLDESPQDGATYTDRRDPKPPLEPSRNAPPVQPKKASETAAAKVLPGPPPAGPALAGQKERSHILKLVEEQGWDLQSVVGLTQRKWQKAKVTELTLPQYQELCSILTTEKPGGNDSDLGFGGQSSTHIGSLK